MPIGEGAAQQPNGYEGISHQRSSPQRRRWKGDARIAARVGDLLDRLLRCPLPRAADAIATLSSCETTRLGRPRGARLQGRLTPPARFFSEET